MHACMDGCMYFFLRLSFRANEFRHIGQGQQQAARVVVLVVHEGIEEDEVPARSSQLQSQGPDCSQM